MTNSDLNANKDNEFPLNPPVEMKKLTRLVGIWDLKGKSLNAKEDDIFGKTTINWILGGFYLELKGDIEIKSSNFKLYGLEIIGYDPHQKIYPSVSFSSMSSIPMNYYWNVNGDEVTHWTKGAKYTGIFSQKYTILSGGWRADEGEKITPGNTYDAIMTKIV